MNWSKLKFWKKEIPKPKIIIKEVIKEAPPKIIIKEVIKQAPPKIIIKQVIKEAPRKITKPKLDPKTKGWKRWRFEKDGLTKFQVVRKKRIWDKVTI